MRFFHPSRRALQEWLDHGGDESLTDHIDDCQRCASVIEQLTEGEEHAVGVALSAFFEPPADLANRLEEKVAARLDSRVVLGVVSDLFGAGVDTGKLLLFEETPDE